MSRIRVLVVDDSAYVRKVLREMLALSDQIEVVGTARDGRDALEKVEQLTPDVVTLDLVMPELDGVGFLRAQARRRQIPVVVVSSASEDGTSAAEALEAGAAEFVNKPTSRASDRLYELRDDLIGKVVAVGRRRPEASAPVRGCVRSGASQFDAVVLGISTGGPQALRHILSSMPPDLPVPMAIVLHMPTGYTLPFAEKVNERAAIEVLEASQGVDMRPGRALIARAGLHLRLVRSSASLVVARLDASPADVPHRPSVDVLFQTAADVYGPRLLGVVMTGMGNDGTAGAAWIKSQGGTVYVEAEETCVVYGMPRSVVEAGLADRVVRLDQMVEAICEVL